MRDAEHGDKYYLIDLDTSEKMILGAGIIDKSGDGHPSILGDRFLTDSYPNKARLKNLALYCLQSGKYEVLGEFYESLNYGNETRCDLHPRFSPDGNRVFFDSVHEGRRHLYMMNLQGESES